MIAIESNPGEWVEDYRILDAILVNPYHNLALKDHGGRLAWDYASAVNAKRRAEYDRAAGFILVAIDSQATIPPFKQSYSLKALKSYALEYDVVERIRGLWH